MAAVGNAVSASAAAQEVLVAAEMDWVEEGEVVKVAAKLVGVEAGTGRAAALSWLPCYYSPERTGTTPKKCQCRQRRGTDRSH